jgi:hypothetical protein
MTLADIHVIADAEDIAMKETMLAVSLTVSPWAIWLVFSSKVLNLKSEHVASASETKARAGELFRGTQRYPTLSNTLAEMLFSRKSPENLGNFERSGDFIVRSPSR